MIGSNREGDGLSDDLFKGPQERCACSVNRTSKLLEMVWHKLVQWLAIQSDKGGVYKFSYYMHLGAPEDCKGAIESSE